MYSRRPLNSTQPDGDGSKPQATGAQPKRFRDRARNDWKNSAPRYFSTGFATSDLCMTSAST